MLFFSLVRVAETGMIEVVAHAGRNQGGYVQRLQGAQMLAASHAASQKGEHHLGDAEAMAEVVEGIAAITRLHCDLRGVNKQVRENTT